MVDRLEAVRIKVNHFRLTRYCAHPVQLHAYTDQGRISTAAKRRASGGIQSSDCLRLYDGEWDSVLCEESRNVLCSCSDFELFVGVLLDGFKLPSELRATLFTGSVASVLPYSKEHASDDENYGTYHDNSSQHQHYVSILPTQDPSKITVEQNVYD